MKKTFGYNGGYQIKNLSAQVVGETLDNIVEKTGVLNAEVVLNEAKDKNNPLHNYFEWNNTIAAEKYRLRQANYLIQSVKVQLINENNEAIEIKRAYTNIKEVSNKGFIQTEKIFNDKRLSFLMLNQALKELNDWKERYKNLIELRIIFDAIENFETKAS